MSESPYDAGSTTIESDAGPSETRNSVVAARLRQARELTAATVEGARSTAQSTASMAALEAGDTADAAGEASLALANTIGASVANALQGAARSGGAVVGGAKGTTGGLILAIQIGGGAAGEALRAALGSSTMAAGRLTEAMLVAFEDQEQGAKGMRDATSQLGQELFDASTGAALGALGGLATFVGAVSGGASGAASGTLEGVKQMAGAGADATYAVGKSAAQGGTEVLRRALRRDESAMS